jgi:predicted DNA-binding ribbon-helix-helix protein
MGQRETARMGQSRIKKRSIIVNGHKTSVSLEDEFWDELRDLAAERRVPVTALVNEIDQVPGGNLSSAIRVYLFMQAQQRRSRAA